MNVTALVVSPDGTATLTRITGLNAMQNAVGGHIEALPVPLADGGVCAYGNEEAKLSGLPRNVTAHRMLDIIGWQVGPGDYPAGPVLFLGTRNVGGEDGWIETDVSQTALDAAHRIGVTIADTPS